MNYNYCVQKAPKKVILWPHRGLNVKYICKKPSEKKPSKENVKHRLAFQAHILDSVQDALCAMDENCIITYWNDIAENMFGWKTEEVIGKLSPIRPDSFEGYNLEKLMKDGYYMGEVLYQHRSGTLIYINVHVRVLRGSQGEYKGNVASFRDITRQKRTEVKEKNELEKILKAQDEIFANVSHELKTPLNVIYSTNQLMGFYLKNDLLEVSKDKFSKSIQIIKQNCFRFTKLINNVVDISKIDSGLFKLNLANENIVEIIDSIVQAVEEYIKGKGVSNVFSTNTKNKIIACDPEEIERIVLNLISNAIKFTNAEGNIYVNVTDKVEAVEIAVKDTGVGIEKRYLDSIFERYHQVDKTFARKAEGSGIGLTLVKAIVDMHNGSISVESELGKGSIFKIVLPARTMEQRPITIEHTNVRENRAEMINIEFSDIYNL